MAKTVRRPNFADFVNVEDWEEHEMPPPHVNIRGGNSRGDNYRCVDCQR